ncbi:septal ring lytic transglycosylase RlpA family protein [Halomonas sp. Bachu 37]|uniref:septal ring lytic transglycosylase RlpA family protein n=1 Tax=Halomonas kashgarensis TaxID=3084920 RepID=UPI0032172C41
MSSQPKLIRRLAAGTLALAVLSGCASRDVPSTGSASRAGNDATAPTNTATSSSGGGRYAMSGDAYPLDPPNVAEVPDAMPRIESPSRAGNRPSYEVWGKTYQVLPDSRGYAKQGNASWYGEKFHGYATSNGEIYDMYKMSAAHRSLPLPTYARVTNLDNGRSVIVRVNDRGPFHSDREIDLSYAAAARLNILDDGTGPVRVEAIEPKAWLAENAGAASTIASAAVGSSSVASAARSASGNRGQGPRSSEPAVATPETAATNSATERNLEQPVYLQIAALGSSESAAALKTRLESELAQSVRVQSDTDVHRVQVGPVERSRELDSLKEALRQAGFAQAFVVE